MKKWILCIATIFSLCSSVAEADDFEDAIDATDAYQKGNYACNEAKDRIFGH